MNLSKCYGVYAIVCRVNGRVYVGRTEKNFTSRWTRHRWELNRGVHRNAELQSDWNAYGADAFEFRILFALAEYPTQYQTVSAAERMYIEQHKTNSYNIVDERNVRR